MTEPAPLNLISTAKDLAALAKKLSKLKEIALDTEFIRETTFYPKLEILQIASEDEVWLVDVQAFQEKGRVNTKELKPLIDIFVNPEILKILHAAHGDQECLLSALNVVASPIFDTAVGASLCGLGDNIGLGNLLKTVLGVELSNGYARTNWSKRPLPKPVLEYAALDVKYLIKVAQALFERLQKSERKAWAMELSSKFCNIELYETPPEEIAKRLAKSGKFNIKDYGVLLELVRWREARVRELNVPRRWLADDGVLIDLAKIKPQSEEQLQSFRGLSKSEHKANYAKRIIAAIQHGAESEVEIPAEIKRRTNTNASSDEARSLELLRCCLTVLSDEFQIASKHIVQPGNLISLLRLKAKTIEELEQSGLVSQQLGQSGLKTLFDFLNGSLALTLKRGKIHFLSFELTALEAKPTIKNAEKLADDIKAE